MLPDKDEGPLTQRNRQRHAAVHALMERGVGLKGSMRELRLDPKTVRRFMRAATVEESLTHGPSGRTGMLDAHADYLAWRWDEGCTGAHVLHAELTSQGIHVSKRTVRRFVHRMREHGAPTPRSLAPKAREVSALILTPPDALAEPDRALLKEFSARCLDLATILTLVEEFAEMLVNRRGDQSLDGWINSAKTSGVPELHGFADSPARDLDAVRAGLPLPWSSGVVEGHFNRIVLKRQMFGRAGQRLLPHRILLAH
ncbi:transposase [Streptomyces chrestomyceticus JCM 4735]|uniref:Transposase n=1 Tax=Streptomyces chrestomyceticus JCM 4735 TaxID=1306181 RepID=A0A7U9KN62_9ACTN|nr:transposase [Streptomyces chrestomyceticus]GCD32337.1 transposase [Streptomyces chrestomyceticus JCM 4735]